jgi:hypothetical protein
MVVGGGALVRDVRLALGRVRGLERAEWSLPDSIVGVSEDTTGILASPEFDAVLRRGSLAALPALVWVELLTETSLAVSGWPPGPTRA